MRVLLTGIAGFAGSLLAEHILNTTDAELHGIVHRHDRRIQHLHGQLVLHRGDLRNSLWISEVVEAIQPDVALHLAAWSDVGGSWQQPWTTYELNIQCQLNLLEALRRWQPDVPYPDHVVQRNLRPGPVRRPAHRRISALAPQ